MKQNNPLHRTARAALLLLVALLTSVTAWADDPTWLKQGDVWDSETKTLTVNSMSGADGAYSRNPNIEHVIFGDEVSSINMGAFYNCANLKTVLFDKNVGSIANIAFNGCSSLKAVVFTYAGYGGSLQVYNSSFPQNADLKFYVPIDWYGNIYSAYTRGTFDFYCSDKRVGYNAIRANLVMSLNNGILTVNDLGFIPEGYETDFDKWYAVRRNVSSIVFEDGVESIGRNAFTTFNALTSITIPASVKSIGEYAIAGCYVLTSATIQRNDFSDLSLGRDVFMSSTCSPVKLEYTGNAVPEGYYVDFDVTANTGFSIVGSPTEGFGMTFDKDWGNSEAILRAKQMPLEYSISYNLNGGTISEANPESYTIESDEIKLNIPTKEGYIFAGWVGTGLDAATTSVTIAHGSKGDREYTATWTENVLEIANASDNTSAIADASVSGKTYNVTLTDRSLTKDGAWNTLCLPFDMSAEQIVNSPLAGADIRTLSSSSLENGVLTLNFTPATGEGAVTSITAGKPYIIKWIKADGYDEADPNTRDLKNPVFTGVTISDASADVKTTFVDFKGTYDPIVWDTEKRSILLVGDNNSLYYPQPEGENIPFLNACRAYFELNGLTVGDSNGAREIKLNFEGESTSIHNAQCTMHNEAGAWYDMQGRKVSKPTAKGMYIHGGRKVVLK